MLTNFKLNKDKVVLRKQVKQKIIVIMKQSFNPMLGFEFSVVLIFEWQKLIANYLRLCDNSLKQGKNNFKIIKETYFPLTLKNMQLNHVQNGLLKLQEQKISELFQFLTSLQNKNIFIEMLLQGQSEHYTFSQGKLSLKDTSIDKNPKTVVSYNQFSRPTPEKYHIESIKEYRKELDDLRRKYYELQKAYYHLLGYRGQFSEPMPLPPCENKDSFNLCVTEVSENQCPSTVYKSSTSIYEAIAEIEHNKKRIGKLSHSITDFEIEAKAAEYLGIRLENLAKTASDHKVKTEYDEETEEQLCQALKEIQRLRQMIHKGQSPENQLFEIRISYQEHIKQLQQILERERKHTKMLNGIIKKQRNELEGKQELIQSLMTQKKRNDKNSKGQSA